MSDRSLGRASRRRGARRATQQGATLVMALVMLTLMMIHALASFTAADTQLRNTAALQARQEAMAAAQLAIGGVIGSSAFVTATVATPVDVDIDADGIDDYRVALQATCVSARLVTPAMVAAATAAATADDAACVAAALPSGELPCADTVWNIRAVAGARGGALQSGVSVEVHQGISVRLDTTDALRSCVGLPPGTAEPATRPLLGKARRKTYWYFHPGV